MGDWQINRRLCAEIVSFRGDGVGEEFLCTKFPRGYGGLESMNVEVLVSLCDPSNDAAKQGSPRSVPM